MKLEGFYASRFALTLITALSLLLVSCGEESTARPDGYMRIGLPTPAYVQAPEGLPYTFEMNQSAKWIDKGNGWGDLYYPTLRSRIQLTYKNSQENLEAFVQEAQNMAMKHTVKASGMRQIQYNNPETEVYGLYYHMSGAAATTTQFYLTDSTSQFMRGVLYHFSAPNPDSLRPVTNYMRGEIEHLIESLEWKSNNDEDVNPS